MQGFNLLAYNRTQLYIRGQQITNLMKFCASSLDQIIEATSYFSQFALSKMVLIVYV